MTLLVLALDTLDAALLEEFGVEELELKSNAEMETVAEMRDQPYTPKAWATAAIGLHPRDHVVSGSMSEWSNPIVNFLAKFSGSLSMSMREKIGNRIYIADTSFE